jgi:hypothetical protein
MDSPENPKPRRKRWRILRRVLSLCATFALFLVLLPFILAALVHSQDEGEVLSIPKLKDFISTKMAENTQDYDLELGVIGLSKGKGFLNPKLVLEDVVVRDTNGAPVVRLPRVGADFSIFTAYGNTAKTGSLSIDNAQMFLLRDANGRFNFTNDEEGAYNRSFDQAIDGFFDLPIAKNIESLTISNVSLSYIDGKLKKRFYLNNGAVDITSNGNELMVSSHLELARADKTPTLIRFSGRRTIGDTTSDITFKIDNADPVSLANQIPALDWLRNIEAEASASFVVELDGDARPKAMNGVLDLGHGRLRETPASRGAEFEAVKTYFEFDAIADKLDFSAFEMVTTLGSVDGTASAELERDLAGRVIGAKLDLGVDELSLNQPELFSDPLIFNTGKVQADVQFTPIAVKVKKAVLNHETLSVITSGDLWARSDFWQSRFDIRLDQLTAQQLKKLWPVNYIPKTRAWIVKNVHQGVISDFNGYFQTQDGETDLDFKFAFDDVSTGLVATVDPLTDGYGEGSLTQKQVTLNLASGVLTPKGGKPLDISGSVLHIPNIKVRPAIGQISLNATGDLKSALKVLDAPKFRFIEKFGKTTDVATGNASVTGWLELPLAKGVKQNEIKFDFKGAIENVVSSELIKGRKLTANSIDVHAQDSQIALSGGAKLDGVPTNFKWNQPFVNNPSKQSTLSGALTLTQSSLDTFNIALPKGSFSGSTSANMDITLRPKSVGTFTLSSNLKGAALKIDALGWSKSKNAKGKLSVKGELSEPIKVKSIDLTANGLTAVGNISLNKNGGFQAANFPTLKIGKWLSTSVSLTGQGQNATTKISGGSMDLRQLNFGQSTGGGKAGPLVIALDRLRLTNDLSLTSFNASISRNGAPTGSFNARVNGGARITGQITRGKRGAKITIKGKDAGAILKSAGFFDNIREGDTTIVLEPGKEPNVYVGRFEATNLRMKHSNSMAKLLDGISLVGLLQKLEKSGIQFSKAKGGFTLRPEGVQLQEVSLVGVSMGISLQGWYASKTKTVNFDGVVTPLYAVNGAFERIAGKLFGRQKGEGVFSFVYTMKGKAANPKVKVKPLSILTPGVFRQVFRQDIPAPPK